MTDGACGRANDMCTLVFCCWFFKCKSQTHRRASVSECVAGKEKERKGRRPGSPGRDARSGVREEKEKERQKAVGFDGVPFLFQRVYIRNTQKYAPHRCFLQEIRSTRRRRGPSFDLQNEQRTHKNNPNENPGEGPTESWLYVA